MRVLVTGVTEPSGCAVARMLVAAGHEVAGLDRRWHRFVDPRVRFIEGDPADAAVCARAAAGCASVLHLAGAGVGTIAVAARDAGVRVVIPVVAGVRSAGMTDTEAGEMLHRVGADSLLVRTAAVAGRRIDQQTRRALEPILGSRTSSEGYQLLHTDDLERFLVLAATSQRTGTVELAASGIVTPEQVRGMLRASGVRYSAWVPGWSTRRPLLDPTAAQNDWGFRCGWTAPEVIADLVRGMIGRKPDGGGFRTRRGAIPLPAHVIPSGGGTSDHHKLESVDWVDPADPVDTATSTSDALSGPLTPLTFDLHAGAIRLADEAMGTIALQPPGKPPMPAGLAGAATTFTAIVRRVAMARRFRDTAELVDAASRAETLNASEIRALTDAQLHVRALLWRDRLHQAWQAASIEVMLTGAATAAHACGKGAGEVPRERARDAVARITHCLHLAVRERAVRLVRAGRLIDSEDACYLTLDEIFTVPADVAERVRRRRAEPIRRHRHRAARHRS
ncbi:NAD-dependent epimerase/dehydratase family protein [Nocardia sp. NPDC052566]|uniref:NAD-dependent epimerase/dehydratase family protein n=1 Tax=Nocardia sp. NPDC052566 TaxID=3364330 RepID=UPI0037C613A5